MSVNPFVIIGGGAAGLSAAIQLAKLGHASLVLEKNEFKTPRMCGEFLSPECLPILQSWQIKPACRIREIKFHYANGDQLQMDLPLMAGSMIRSELETALFDYAKALGVELRAKQNITQIIPHVSGKIELQIAGQASVFAECVIVSAGRYHQTSSETIFLYEGQKAHFRGQDIPDCLEMHIAPGAYFGVIPVAKDLVNVALLMRAGQALPASFTKRLAAWQRVDEWLQGRIPEFGIKPNLNIKNVYQVGDAAASIPPITGDGVGMAVTSGVMVAEMAVQKRWRKYHRQWHRQFSSRIIWGKRLHKVALSAPLTKLCMRVVQRFPAVGKFIFSHTRGVKS
ncbi:MAG: FAD-dependent monooxygenase [Gammaproteobacteria bacterium]|nr:FAD-dependent monooxygenase [Gammaproteobacteria bacterium]